MLSSIRETVEYLEHRVKMRPKICIILGTGLGQLADEIEPEISFPYNNIPNFPISTVESHAGRLHFGKLMGVDVVAMQGRFHYYEGYTMQQITFPLVVLRQLGIEYLLVSNASGGLNPAIKVSELMLITDHINLFPDHPLRGKYRPITGPRFPQMLRAYDREMLNMVREIARENNLKLHEGVYAAVMGPSLETPAEYRYLRTIGADAVGMSTIPEVIVANSMGIRVCAISAITDEGFPEEETDVTIESVIEAAKKAEPSLSLIFKKLVEKIG